MRLLTPAELRNIGPRQYSELLGRTDMLVAAADGEVSGLPAAVLLTADYAAMQGDGVLDLRDATPQVRAAIGWRLSTAAAWPPLSFPEFESAGSAAAVHAPDGALAAGLIDEVIATDAEAWFARWLHGRSVAALESAAMLIRMRGGDALERAEFARLFATGQPQEGLRAFLEKRPPRF